MGLLKKIFRSGRAEAVAAHSRLEEDDTPEQASRNGPRRELVQVVLRDTMRRHAVPSDWIDCRILSVIGRTRSHGMHVHFVVRGGHDRLLAYIPAFQQSFKAEMERLEPRYAQWLLSLSWEFEGLPASGDAVGRDLAKLPDGNALSAVEAADACAAAPAPSTIPAPATAAADDENVLQDLEALFAIRDAALRQTAGDKAADFEPTRPGHHRGTDGSRG